MPIWVRVVSKIGFWCTVFTYLGYVLLIAISVYSVSPIYAGIFDGFIAMPAFITCLVILICGVALLKPRTTFGGTLTMLGIFALLLWILVIPQL